jgi:hypothetical protein
MTIEILLFSVRVGLIICLYAFVGLIAWLLWRDLHPPSGHSDQAAVTFQAQLLDIKNQRVYWASPVTGIGRAAHNTIQLSAETISLEHALLTQRAQQWWLEDLNSSNGTQLNGVPVVSATVVRPGDIIGVGEVLLRFEAVRV